MTDHTDDRENSSLPEREDPQIILLAGEICDGHMDIVNTLLHYHYGDFKGPVQLLINSPGGQVDVGWAIIDTMNFIRLPVYTIAVGYVCSMAADIFVNGDVRTAGEHSTLMIHQHSTGAIGKYSDMIAAAEGDRIEHERRLKHYQVNSKYKTQDKVKEKLFKDNKDLWLTPDEMLKHGLCDKIALANKAKRRKDFS